MSCMSGLNLAELVARTDTTVLERSTLCACASAIESLAERVDGSSILPPSTVALLAGIEEFRPSVETREDERIRLAQAFVRSETDLVSAIESSGGRTSEANFLSVVSIVMLLALEVLAMQMKGAWASQLRERVVLSLESARSYVVADYPELGGLFDDAVRETFGLS